jgi:hypothetical protein
VAIPRRAPPASFATLTAMRALAFASLVLPANASTPPAQCPGATELADGNTVEGTVPGSKWRCQHEMAIARPERMVVDFHPGPARPS